MCKAIDDLENDAIEKGKAIGKSEAIIELLEEYGEVSNELRSMISSQNNLDILSRWFKLAIKVSSVQEFSDKI